MDGKYNRTAEVGVLPDGDDNRHGGQTREETKRVLQSPLVNFYVCLYPMCNKNKVPMLQELAIQDAPTFLASAETHLSNDF